MNISEGKIRNEKANREKLQSADSKRLNLLRNFNEDAYKGVQWLRQNKDSENFENPGGIYEPIMTVVRKVFSILIFRHFSTKCALCICSKIERSKISNAFSSGFIKV